MIKWWLLFVLVWSQAAFAAHQFSHELADIGEVCAVCLHFDRDDEAAPDAGSCHCMPAVVPGDAAVSISPGQSEPFRLYRSRASP
jgi:hypothetical protein